MAPGLGRRVALMSACLAASCLFGCSRSEPTPPQKTVAEIRAEIQKVEADSKMPARPKAMVLGLLRGQLDRAEKAEKGAK